MLITSKPPPKPSLVAIPQRKDLISPGPPQQPLAHQSRSTKRSLASPHASLPNLSTNHFPTLSTIGFGSGIAQKTHLLLKQRRNNSTNTSGFKNGIQHVQSTRNADRRDTDGVTRRIRGWRRRRRGLQAMGQIWTLCVLVFLGLSCIEYVSAIPVAQADPATLTSSTSISTPSPSATIQTVSSTSSSSSVSRSSVLSSTTTSVPGTVVTDSPLVRTRSLSSDSALASGSSAQNSSFSLGQGSPTVALSSGTSIMDTTKTPVPSPTTNDDDTPNSSPQEKTYNSLVNFYFLILAAAIGFAVLGWWLWRRRRRGKTTRDQRRGLEALRRDLELGRLRRGFRGVVGRGSHSTTAQNVNEELPAYQSVRNPPVAVTRPPGYEEVVTRSRTTSAGLQTIEEESTAASRAETPDVTAPPRARAADDRPPGL